MVTNEEQRMHRFIVGRPNDGQGWGAVCRCGWSSWDESMTRCSVEAEAHLANPPSNGVDECPRCSGIVGADTCEDCLWSPEQVVQDARKALAHYEAHQKDDLYDDHDHEVYERIRDLLAVVSTSNSRLRRSTR